MVWPFTSKEVKEKSEILMDYTPTMNFGEVTHNLTEQFKGEVQNKKVKFPALLGEEHPFDFKITEGLYKKFGFFTAVIDKYVDYVVGPGFYIESKDERAKTIIEDFMRDVNFDTLLRGWTKEALIKGNGYLEIGGSKKEGVAGLKILNADYMYVNRDKFGKILNYNQYKGGFNKFAKEQVIEFKPHQIAHVPFNQVGDCAYGLGIGFPALTMMNYTIQQSTDMHMIMNKKANAPLHATLGKIDGNTKIIPKPADVAAFGQKLETMNNKQEWATDPLVNFKVIDYGNIGEKFEKTLEYDIDMLIYAFQIPGVLLGMARIPEGLARVQMDAFQRRIQSIQAELEKIIEKQIFDRVLQANGFGEDVDVEFEWGAPSVIEVEGKMTLMSELIKSPTTGFALKSLLEDELVNLLKLNTDEYELLKEEEEKREKEFEEQRPQPLVPGQNKGFPQKPVPKPAQPAQPKPVVPKTNQGITVSITEVIRGITSTNDEHHHTYVTDDERTGTTEDTIPESHKVHVHNIIKGIVEEMNDHKHTIAKQEKYSGKKKPKPKVFPKIKQTSEVKRVSSGGKSHIHYEGQKICPHCTESIGHINDIEEWLGFKYKEYLSYILEFIDADGFDRVRAITEIEASAGRLTNTQVGKLKGILSKGMKKGESIEFMSKAVDKNVGLKDLYRMTEDGIIKTGASGLPILAISKEKRASLIVRSEITRVSNEGAVEYYKSKGFKRVEWVSSFGERTCPDCEALNGKIFPVGEHPQMPLHGNCRCALIAVEEIV